MEHIPKEKKRAKNRRACPLPGDESQLPVHYSAGEPRLEIIGDLPIYVPYDSCDVWANPSLFQLDETGLPTGVAGCAGCLVTPRSAWCCKWASAG